MLSAAPRGRGSGRCQPFLKRTTLLRHPRYHGCVLRREGGSHSLWVNPRTGAMEAIPRHTEIANLLARKIYRSLSILEVGQSS